MLFRIILLSIFIINLHIYSGGLGSVTLVINNINNFDDLPNYGEYDGDAIIAGDRRIDGSQLRGWTLLREDENNMKIIFSNPGATTPSTDPPIEISLGNGNILEIKVTELNGNDFEFQINNNAPTTVKLSSYNQIGYDLDGNPTDEGITYGPTPDSEGNILLTSDYEETKKVMYIYAEIYGRKSRRIITIYNNKKYTHKLKASDDW